MRRGHVLWYARSLTKAQHIHIWLWEQTQPGEEANRAGLSADVAQEQCGSGENPGPRQPLSNLSIWIYPFPFRSSPSRAASSRSSAARRAPGVSWSGCWASPTAIRSRPPSVDPRWDRARERTSTRRWVSPNHQQIRNSLNIFVI